MARLCGASCGLILFSASLLMGVSAGDSAQSVLMRSLRGLFAGFVFGAAVGWVGVIVARDNLKDLDEEPAANDAVPTRASKKIEEPVTVM